jgi:hypothetical protein
MRPTFYSIFILFILYLFILFGRLSLVAVANLIRLQVHEWAAAHRSQVSSRTLKQRFQTRGPRDDNFLVKCFSLDPPFIVSVLRTWNAGSVGSQFPEIKYVFPSLEIDTCSRITEDFHGNTWVFPKLDGNIRDFTETPERKQNYDNSWEWQDLRGQPKKNNFAETSKRMGRHIRNSNFEKIWLKSSLPSEAVLRYQWLFSPVILANNSLLSSF